MMTSRNTLLDVLHERVCQSGRQCAYTLLHDGGAQTTTITYAELDRRARAIAARLQAQYEFGQRALLSFQPGLDFISAFWGCLYAGVIAVPVPALRTHRSMRRFDSILADSGAKVVLTTAEAYSRLEPTIHAHPSLWGVQWVATDQVDDHMAEQWTTPCLAGDTVAFLQYTSGSTASPKGVMVSHNNLLHNSAAIQAAFQHTPDSIVVSWLPFHHDMGLIGGLLQPLFVGCGCYLMSPTAFMKNPIRWLQAISGYGATTSGGPNFAYEACLQAITPELLETLDLRRWKVAFTGAEPICADTLRRFSEVFGPARFSPEAFLPCYGLAEATLMATAKKHACPTISTVLESALHQHGIVKVSANHPMGKSLVSSGHTFCGTEVAIVDPQTGARCSKAEVGEIWISGASVALGYWNNPDASRSTFQAFIQGTDEGPYLRSGDLGFMDDGEVYVTGRLKDLVIIQGRNYYPQDLEWTVTHSETVLSGYSCAAFSIEVSGEERLVIVQEVSLRDSPDLGQLIGAIRLAIAREHEIEVYGITFIKAGSLPKTTSGKIERHTCKAMYHARTFKAIGGWRVFQGVSSFPEPDKHPLSIDESKRDAEPLPVLATGGHHFSEEAKPFYSH